MRGAGGYGKGERSKAFYERGDNEEQKDDDNHTSENGNPAKTVNFHSFQAKLEAKIRKKVKSRFFESEAQLSGSGEESDEDVDLREEDDVMMAEEGDLDEMPDDEELIEQIGETRRIFT